MAAMGLSDGEAAILSKRPYINSLGALVVDVPSGRTTKGAMTYRQREIASPGNFNANATLRKDEWLTLDLELLESFRERLTVVDDLRAKGLVHNVGGLGVIISEWENASEITDAAIDMTGEPPGTGQKDRQEFGLNGVPIPVIHKEFDIGERVLMASRTRGASLDVTTGLEASRSCARTVESMFVNGVSGALGASNSAGNTYLIYGFTNFPNRVQYTTLSDWSDSATTQETILSEILQMVQTMEEDQRRFGPFGLYIPADCSFQFYDDYKAESDKTLMQRVLEDPRIEFVKVADTLAAGNVLLIQLDKSTVDIAEASPESNIQWASGSGWTNHFQTFAALAPRIKTDFDGRCGVLHGTEGSS
jgi:hypothetical protein